MTSYREFDEKNRIALGLIQALEKKRGALDVAKLCGIETTETLQRWKRQNRIPVFRLDKILNKLKELK